MRTFVQLGLAVGALSICNVASAHIALLSPASRESQQKQGPCGVAGSVRGTNVTVAPAGSTLHIEWHETVDHPSHFRISFDDDGDDDFVDPTSFDDRYTNDTVLMDGISDAAGGTFTADVPMPDIECDHCTLQLIQVMLDKAPYEPGTNDVYYRCIDLTLTRDPITTPSDGGTANSDAGSGTPAGPGSPPASADDAAVPSTDGTSDTGTDSSYGTQPAPSSQPSAESDGATSGGCSAAPGANSLPAAWLLCLFAAFAWSLHRRVMARKSRVAVRVQPVLALRRGAKSARKKG